MTERDAEDIYLKRIVEVHELFDSLYEMIYIITNNINSDVRRRQARTKFGISLVKLGLIK